MRSLLVWILCSTPLSAADVSFRQEVMAVLSRGGCNQGACHGNLNGKGGFKLSLRGEDSTFDRNAILKESLGRRVDIQHPAESLLLRKATGQTPHEGGPRFSADSSEYRLLSEWIRQGCPSDPDHLPKLLKLQVSPTEKVLISPANKVQLDIKGTFSDGSTRDLAHLVTFEPTVVGLVSISPTGEVVRQNDGELTVLVRYLEQMVPVQLVFAPARAEYVKRLVSLDHPIDRLVFPPLETLRLSPSPLASDQVFVRRAYLDATGCLPTADEARGFVTDSRPDKRAKLIDRLLAKPEFADYWAQKWSDLLRNEEKALDSKGVRLFYQWIRDSIAADRPLNEFAAEIVRARGNTYENPPANLYRSLREPYGRAESIAQVFLGIRLQCAKCHNHPFDQWTQTDYHEFAAIFSKLDYRIVENNRRDMLDKHEFIGAQIVFTARDGILKHPVSGKALSPRLLGETKQLPPQSDSLDEIAEWLSRPENPFFAKVQANRVWYHLMGRGLVDPIDDFRSSNPATNEPLLKELARSFQQSGFKLKSLVRLIMTSRAYQLSASPAETNADDETRFSRAIIRPLQAEQMLDAISRVTGVSPRFESYPKGTRAGQLAAPPLTKRGKKGLEAERFLKVFGQPERLLTCECERPSDTGLVQTFQLLSGEMINGMLTQPGNRLGKLLESKQSDAEIVEELYWSALSRGPTSTELSRLSEFVAKSSDRRAALEDVVWGLINSKEFQLRR
jgi:hypothetical protein